MLVLSVWHRPDIAVALAILSVLFTLLELCGFDGDRRECDGEAGFAATGMPEERRE